MPGTMNEPIWSGYPADTHHVELAQPQRGHSFTVLVASWPAQPQAHSRDDRVAFRAMLPMLIAKFPGEYVAVKDGQIVDHDLSRRALAERFFKQHGDVPVYMPFVGARRVLRQTTPFLHRRA